MNEFLLFLMLLAIWGAVVIVGFAFWDFVLRSYLTAKGIKRTEREMERFRKSNEPNT